MIVMAKLIELKGISKSYDGEKVIDSINLYIRDGEFITLLGPSGCGKTTTLRIIGGFETADEGKIYFNGVEMSDVPAYKRQINTVFQKYALFPHLNVYENIAFPLRLKKIPKENGKGYKKLPEEEIKKRVDEMLSMVALSGFENKSVSTLSGGQQQRVAIARALVSHPKVLLLDEPLGALDLKLRKDMQNELKTIQQAIGITFIYVTHDQEEALSMSDTIVVMANGEIQQMVLLPIFTTSRETLSSQTSSARVIFSTELCSRTSVLRSQDTYLTVLTAASTKTSPLT